jgi:hypothetical protein
LNFSVASHTDASCYGGSNGTATLTVFGGSGTYHFLWNDPSAQTSATATGLAAGTYTATVTDDSACVATTSVTIAEPTAVTFATPTILRLCALEVQMEVLLHLPQEEQVQLLIAGVITSG